MDIKSKNKYVFIIVFIIGVYMLGLLKLSVEDVIKNRNYLKADPYLTSAKFKGDILSYFNNIQALNGVYKDYSKESDAEKVTTEELVASKTFQVSALKAKEVEIENKYQYLIETAKNESNKDKFNSLTEAKSKELNEVIKENSKNTEDFVKEIAAYKNKDYENIKRAVNEKSIIKYYIKNGKNNVIDTNIENVSDIALYIKNNAMYSMKFPEQTLYNYDNLFSMNQWFKVNNAEGYFIIPKDIEKSGYIYGNYNYYNSVKARLIKEIIIGAGSLIIGFLLLLYIYKRKSEKVQFLEKLTNRYSKIPLDLKIFIFIFYPFILDICTSRIGFFYKPYNLAQLFKLTIESIYIFYIIINVNWLANLIGNKEQFRLEIKTCWLYRLRSILKDSAIAKGTKVKVLVFIILTALLGVAAIGVVIGIITNNNIGKMISLGAVVYILCYMILMLFNVLKISGFLMRIVKGTEEIVSGNLNYTIAEKGRGDLFKIANNINNIKATFKKSLENEIKSERLKSELITNVSHDLKTPLTSIINYVDLLKKEDLTKEESQKYIEVLDRKSQRLKVLIDDLFEASKMASGAVELNIEKVDVTALLQQALAELHEKINNSSLIFKLKMPENKVYANLDGKKTWRVFENLINNILKYSQEATRVYIELIEEDGKIIITMKNISSYEMNFDKEEIFERFKRGDKSRNTEGSGLGLSIAKSILELQNGNLTIEIDGDLFKAKVIVIAV